ncbi:MAG TPA: phosphate ABC transporter substrate-binding protein PstS [Gemmataceae bacterium]|nr:phosphate ABC transporter substrate-binding protein PstS [Gemmataceae bacterium]
MKRAIVWTLVGLALGALAGCSGGKSGQRISGSGSTFVAPLLAEKWAPAYKKARDREVDYNAVGSGAGIKDLMDKQVAFACSDAPLNHEQMDKAKETGDVIHVPLVVGAVAIMYNLPDVKEPIHFTGPILADIYLGKISKWNDERLKEVNKDVKLPDTPIAVVARSDGSGTSFIFTGYLAKVSEAWKKDVGEANTLPKWPQAVKNQEKGSGGVAGLVQKTPGAIGYVELRYTRGKEDIKYGKVENDAKKFVLPSLDSTVAATDNLKENDIPDDLRFSMTNLGGEETYPICGAVWAVMFTKQKPETAQALKDFFSWVLTTGQEMCKPEDYAPLPKALVERAQKKVDSIKGE